MSTIGNYSLTAIASITIVGGGLLWINEKLSQKEPAKETPPARVEHPQAEHLAEPKKEPKL